jgi:hypothetical protein
MPSCSTQSQPVQGPIMPCVHKRTFGVCTMYSPIPTIPPSALVGDEYLMPPEPANYFPREVVL